MFGKDKPESAQPGPLDTARQAAEPKPQAAQPSAAPAGSSSPSIISRDMKVVGNLHSAGDIQIDGAVEGDVNSKTLTIGEGAQITGSITAESVRICGRISGQVQATLVRVAATAHVKGDITYEKLSIEEEAVLDGQIRRATQGKPQAAPVAAEAPKPADPKVAPIKPAEAKPAGAQQAGGSVGGGSRPGGG